MASGYDPRRSKVSASTEEQFRTNDLGKADLVDVPGIGPAAAAKLKAEGVTNTYQLIAKYLEMAEIDGNGVDTYLLNQTFWTFLKTAGIQSHRSAIVKAISEKVASNFPAFHDANIYDDDEDDDE